MPPGCSTLLGRFARGTNLSHEILASKSMPVPAQPMRIAIMGTPVSSGNMGVQALGASLVSLCRSAAPGASLRILTGHSHPATVTFCVAGRDVSVPVVNNRLSPRSAPREHMLFILLLAIVYRLLPLPVLRSALGRFCPWIGALRESDIVGDIRGGDSFSDIYGLSRYLMGFMPVWTVLLVKRSIVLFPQTYGPYKSPVARWIARYIIRHASVVVARDRESQRVAQSLARPGQEILLSPDVAFSLEPVVPSAILLDPPCPNPQPPNFSSAIVGLNVNGLMYNGGYTRKNMFGLKMDYPSFLKELAIALLSEHAGELWLIPHTYAPPGDVESDQEGCRRLLGALPAGLHSRIRIVNAEYNQHEIKGVIGQCDFFIGSRMHSCIAALSQGIPCVGVAYSRKFEGVFDSVGVADWVVDGRSATNDEAVDRVLTLYRRRDQIREPLRRNSDQARSRLTGVFREIVTRSAGDRVLN